MKIVIMGGNQPYFMPYIGYWQLINAVDVFIISDDYNYINGGWINRNRILEKGSPGILILKYAMPHRIKKLMSFLFQQKYLIKIKN